MMHISFRRYLLRTFQVLLVVLFTNLASSCTVLETTPVPVELVDVVSVSGLTGLRSWADNDTDLPAEVLAGFADRFREYNLQNGKTFNVLALSGGGQSGAFGAGLLNGWSDEGTRPLFDVVTGISTGAIIAPFAFLGPRYDPILRTIYTTTTTKDIGKIEVVQGLVAGGGVLNAVGFEDLLSRYVTPQLVEEIARETRKGRMLLIGTTNLEAERGVIWNIGVLAESGYPQKAELLRQIIRASASIPGAFPPVRIKVSHAGDTSDELHVDGGVTEQVFLYPANISITSFERALGHEMDKRVFVVRNAKLASTYKSLKSRTVQIVERSLNTLIKVQGRADVRRIERIAQRDGLEFHLAAIPESFNVESKEFFDPAYMKPLFSPLGFSMAAILPVASECAMSDTPVKKPDLAATTGSDIAWEETAFPKAEGAPAKGAEVISEFVKHLPNSPGVYRMFNEKDDVLYVGKAKIAEEACGILCENGRAYEPHCADDQRNRQYGICANPH